MNGDSDHDVCDWEIKYNEHRKFTNTVIDQYNLMKLNQNKLTTQIKELEEHKKCFLAQISSAKTEVEEKNCIIEKLRTQLKRKEEKHNNALNQLNNACCSHLGADSTCMETELKSTNTLIPKQNEIKLKLDQELLSYKLMSVCEKLFDTKKAYDEIKYVINNDILNIENSLKPMMKLTEDDKNQQKMITQLQTLKEENRTREEKLCRMNKKIKEFERENERNLLKINKQKNQLKEWKLKVESIKLLEDSYERFRQDCECFCVPQNKLEPEC